MKRLLRWTVPLGLILPICAFAQWDDSLLKPYVMNHRGGGASIADVSFLLDAPAGKTGFVHIQGGHLVTGAGKRLRLWGVHITDWSRGSVLLPPKEDAPMWAATLARFGVNCVRLHFLDLAAPRGIIDTTKTDSRSFDPQQLDRLDYFFAELKKRGIYADLNLNVGRSYKAGDGVQDFDKIQWGKGLTLYDPRLIELEQEYARNLLTHLNPYTKLEYRNDPAIAIVELLNENGLYLGFRAPTPYYDEELNTQYDHWLRQTQSPEALQKLRELAGVTADAPIPRLKGPEVAAAPKERYETELLFYMYAEDRFYQIMSGFLRSAIGVKVPITGTADHSHASSPYTMLASLSKLDTGMKWNDAHTRVANQGESPSLIEPVAGTVVLRGLEGAVAVSASALDGSGRQMGEAIAAKKQAGGWALPIGDPVTTWYVVSVKRQ